MYVTHFAQPPPLTFEQVGTRFLLASGFWLWFDFLFLLTALFHGLNGLRTIIYDFRPGPRVKMGTTIGMGRKICGWTWRRERAGYGAVTRFSIVWRRAPKDCIRRRRFLT